MNVREHDIVVTALLQAHPGFDSATVDRRVTREASRYATAKIQTFVPVLVQRAVHAQLGDLERRHDDAGLRQEGADELWNSNSGSS